MLNLLMVVLMIVVILALTPMIQTILILIIKNQ